MSKPVHFTLDLPPTYVKLDIYLGGSKKAVCKLFHENYGEPVSYYEEVIRGSFCALCQRPDETGERIVMCVSSVTVPIIAHEILHVTWKLDKLVGFNFTYENQELQAYLMSYLLEKIMPHVK